MPFQGIKIPEFCESTISVSEILVSC